MFTISGSMRSMKARLFGKQHNYTSVNECGNQDESKASPSKWPVHMSILPNRSMSRGLLLALISVGVCLLLFKISLTNVQEVATSAVHSSYYHMIIPASEANPNLCKTLFSAAALDYPTPRIINWQRKFDDPNLIFGGSHIAKIEGVLNFLRQLGPASDDELVSIVDGYDIWFQLRPEVMIGRYHEINERAKRRIQSRLGSKTVERENFKQTVVFSSQKKCWPASGDDPACFAMPDSELADDIYGPSTDHDTGDEKNPFAKMRQRYLNSGTVIGPVGDVRAIYERALDKLSLSANIGSDQGIFAEILGEQEYQREVARVRYLPWWQGNFAWLLRKLAGLGDERDLITLDHPTHHRMGPVPPGGKRYEFHIGLDYRSELSQPTVFSEEDLAWIKHDQSDQIRAKSSQVGIVGPPRIDSLPGDIAMSRPPYLVSDFDSSQNLPTDVPWTTMNTYTNLWTGVTPVAIHHNAHRDGLKGRINTFWNETWFFPHLRDLLQARAAAVRAPHAILLRPGEAHSKIEEWWGPVDERGGARIEIGALPGDWLSWQDICGSEEVASEVFRDSKGPWKDNIVSLSWNQTLAEEQLETWRARTGYA